MNTFGNTFRLTTFGESHGTAMGGIIDGCPAGVVIDQDFINTELLRRRDGDTISSLTTARKEPDQIEWLSGIMEGKTLGTPIAFLVRNQDFRSEDYNDLQDSFRPGHADYTWFQRYGRRDHRGGGRASGRETVSRVIGGAIAKLWLATQGVTIHSLRQGFDVKCIIEEVPGGIGNPVFDRLNARLSYAMQPIPSASSFEMGENPGDWKRAAGDYPDQWIAGGEGATLTATNHCGGVQGGISNGMPIVFHTGFHPPVTNPDGMVCRMADGSLKAVVPHGRHDQDHGTRLPVIVESMAALVLADFLCLRVKRIDELKIEN
jgi:chorismate synthase